MNTSKPILYIDTLTELNAFCQQLTDLDWLALDTEFLRDKTFYPKFCLLQIATPELVACVDPLCLSTLTPLLPILYDPKIIKVFHAGRQDLEIFYHLCGKVPQPVFDTQIAAPLLGYPEQISYAELAFEFLGIRLDKAHSRTDWSQRPLSHHQLRYAAEDVIYLGQLYLKLRQRLISLGRLNWLEEDFKELADPALYQSLPDQAWRRIKAAQRLKDRQLSVLQTLAAWREETARSENRPRSWILKDDVLLDTARLLPESLQDLKTIRGISERGLKQYGQKLCALIQEAKQRAPIPSETASKMPRKTPEQEAMLDLLMAVVRIRAMENSLNPNVLAPKKDLEGLIWGNARPKILQGWRRAMIGEELKALLEGRKSLTVANGTLQIDDR